MNLIVTCPRFFEDDAARELVRILGDASTERSHLPGIITAEAKTDPVEACETVARAILEEPWTVRYMLRVIPVQECVECSVERIADLAGRLARTIRHDETYRVTLEKRDNRTGGKMIIDEVASRIPNRVSLDSPDWIVLVEIIGDVAGVSVVKKRHIVSVELLKRS